MGGAPVHDEPGSTRAQELDVALLRASVDLEAKPLPAGAYVPLELAAESADAASVRIPGFRASAVQAKQASYPASAVVHVRVGDGTKLLHLDHALDAGYAGAPAIDHDGRVIGIVAAL